MSKYILLFFIGFTSLVSKSQSFTRTYALWAAFDNKGIVTQDWVTAKTVFVFNANNSTDVIWYYPSGKSDTFIGIGGVKTGTTKGGQGYQYITALSKSGEELYFQLFDTVNSLRVLYPNGSCFEFASPD